MERAGGRNATEAIHLRVAGSFHFVSIQGYNWMNG